MAHKMLLEGTAYTITTGRALVSGTVRTIQSGIALISSTVRKLEFGVSGTIIKFTIMDAGKMTFTEYSAIKDMTWKEWCASAYNTGGFTIQYGSVCTVSTVGSQPRYYYVTQSDSDLSYISNSTKIVSMRRYGRTSTTSPIG